MKLQKGLEATRPGNRFWIWTLVSAVRFWFFARLASRRSNHAKAAPVTPFQIPPLNFTEVLGKDIGRLPLQWSTICRCSECSTSTVW